MEKIVTNVELLKVPCEPVSSISEGEEIAKVLFKRLTDGKDSIGLSANQIGIMKRVCVLKIKPAEPIYLINPRIIESEGSLIYMEACLSFPGKHVRTKRYSSITVEADNYANKLYFDASGIPPEEMRDNLDVIECVAAQHEISHLDGKTMYDFEYKLVPRAVEKTCGRNDRVTITNGNDTQIIKFKYFNNFERNGWKLI